VPEKSSWSFGELAMEGFLEFGDGYRTKQSELGQPGLPILRVAEVLDGRIQPEFTDYVHINYRHAMGNKTSQPDDVVLTTKGTVGRVAMIPKEAPEYTYSPQVCFFRTNSASPLLARYLYYWLKSPEFRSQSVAIKGQTDMADYINLSDIGTLRIIVPSIDAQRVVIEMLGALDDKIVTNDRLTKTAWSLAKAYFDQSCREDGPWPEFSIGDIADIYDGPHATPIKTLDGPWFLGISSLCNGFLDLTTSAHLSESDFAQWTRRVTPRAGDILFSYETRLGEAAIMPENIRGCLGRRMALMRPKDNSVGPTLLLLAYLSKIFQERIRIGTIHGATVDRIPLGEFPSWKIALPVAEIRDQLDNILKVIYTRAARSMQENRMLGCLRDELLPRLISGELRIRDAEKAVEDAL
jgi:type I restriction enzyme S subunit